MSGGLTAVTGANGFVGSAVYDRLRAEGRAVRRVIRHADGGDGLSVAIGDITRTTDWSGAVAGADAVVHCAGRAHITRKSEQDANAFLETNTYATLALARAAAAARVRRMVFVSSIKVNGESTDAGRPFRANDPPRPTDAYGESKRLAEAGLREISRETGLEVTIVRPPLVYGSGARANFGALVRWVRSGLPLPFGAVRGNRRSLVAVQNLADFIVTCIDSRSAANATLLVKDGEDVSTAELIERIGTAAKRRPRLVAVPAPMLRVLLAATGRRDLAHRLLGNLEVDDSQTRSRLQWTPPITMQQALAAMLSGVES